MVAVPASVSGSCFVPTGGCTAQSTATTAFPSGGTGSYSYSWTYVSGSVLTVSAPTSAATKFSATGKNLSQTSVYQVTVNDGVHTASFQVAVNLNEQNGA